MSESFKRALENPKAGPRSISLEDYRRRKQQQEVEPQPTPEVAKTAAKTGYRANTTPTIKEFHRLADLAVSREQRLRFLGQAKVLRRALRLQIRSRKRVKTDVQQSQHH